MEVKIIQAPANPIDIMWTAARTCYSATDPITMFEDRYGELSDGYEHTQEYIDQCTEKHWKLVKTVLDSGHQSIAEHINFTFAISGISRACSHQLVRHRAGIVFSQQSQRYVEIKEDYQTIYDLLHAISPAGVKNDLIIICNKYFVDVKDTNYSGYAYCLLDYLKSTSVGVKAEDARNILPNATKTNIVMTVNFRQLMHICNLRLCTRAQKEIRMLFMAIKKAVTEYNKQLGNMLVPSCEVTGFCQEHKCCGRKPSLKELKSIYEQYKEDYISKEDLEKILSDGESNIKLQKLMQMKSVLE